MKKLIIHMVNGNEYYIFEGENFDKSISFSLDEFADNIAKLPTRFVKISKSDGYIINCGFRLEEVTLNLKSISSIDLVEAD